MFFFPFAGITSPDVALYESLKLLSSLLIIVVGKNLYASSSSSTSETRFTNQGVTLLTLTLTAVVLRKVWLLFYFNLCLFLRVGDNLLLKWLLLSELLDCSKKIVAVRRTCGTISDARRQCLDALKLAVKLQAPTLYVHIVALY